MDNKPYVILNLEDAIDSGYAYDYFFEIDDDFYIATNEPAIADLLQDLGYDETDYSDWLYEIRKECPEIDEELQYWEHINDKIDKRLGK